MSETSKQSTASGLLSISPLIVFLCLYLVTSLILQDFYKVPITIAFTASSIYAIIITRGIPFSRRIEHFSAGAANPNIMLMIWIFILAGAFAGGARAMGSVDATVNLTLAILPDKLLLSGIFLAACFISLSIGTSVGTIVALTPVAVGLAEHIGIQSAYIVGLVVGGAFFGDNLSFISDTTIAATRTQGCQMRDKFLVNSLIAIPAAILILIVYTVKGMSMNMGSIETTSIQWLKVIPYLIVLVTAIFGVNVFIVLALGILATGCIGFFVGIGFFDWFNALGNGVQGMSELIIVTLLAGGLLEIIRLNGGINFLIEKLTAHVSTQRGAEFCIATLVSLANLCTANNTIAIITTGPIAHDIAKRFQVDARKSASLLDTFSCLTQGIIPYGAQMLMAAGLSSLSPISIIPYLYYPLCLGFIASLSIIFRFPRKFSKPNVS